jgi:hypothetical protein
MTEKVSAGVTPSGSGTLGLPESGKYRHGEVTNKNRDCSAQNSILVKKLTGRRNAPAGLLTNKKKRRI